MCTSRVTSPAFSYVTPFFVPPAADAVSVHFPGVTTVTTLPLTVHTLGVLDVYVTGKPADDTPDNLMLVVPTD
jgi:hypothetical protein